MCGSTDDAISCSDLNVSVWSGHIRLRKKNTLISLCSYVKAESCFFQGESLAGKQVHCWELPRAVQISPPPWFSKPALSASLSGLNSWKPNLACPWNSCGCSSNEPSNLLPPPLSPLIWLLIYISILLSQRDLLKLKVPRGQELGFFPHSTQPKCSCEIWREYNRTVKSTGSSLA